MNLFTTLAKLLSMTAVLLLCTNSAAGQLKGDSLFTAHRWIMAERLELSGDTVVNSMLLMHPCVKDNILVFNTDGTYLIKEGTMRCNTDTIMGTGVWQYDPADTTLLERYGSGGKIPKKILFLNDDILRIQFAGEQGRIVKQSYLSENGSQKTAEYQIVTEESSISMSILEMVQNWLQSAGHYRLIHLAELQKGATPFGNNTEDTIRPLVILAPFQYAEDTTSSVSRNNGLLTLAMQAGASYIITGRMQQTKAIRKKDNFIDSVQFALHVLDIKKQCRYTDVFDTAEEPVKEKRSGLWDRVGKVVDMAGKLVNIAAPLVYARSMMSDNIFWYNYYSSPVPSGLLTQSQALFSQGNKEERRKHYDSASAIINSVAQASDVVLSKVAAHTAIPIKINRVEGSGKNLNFVIEAGSALHIKEGEILQGITINTTLVNGKSVNEITEIGKLKVTKVVADVLAYCEPDGRKNKIPDFIAQNPGQLSIVTCVQSAKTAH